MFEDCTTLEQLNARRKEVILKGQFMVAAVNAEYNRARRALLENKPQVNRIPVYTAEPAEPRTHVPYPLKTGVAAKNVIMMLGDCIYI